MQTVKTIEAVRAHVRGWHAAGERVALVPTMGNLQRPYQFACCRARARGARHRQHLRQPDTVRAGRAYFALYPRTLLEDEQVLRDAHCDLLFAPSVAEIYPCHGTQQTLVSVRGLAEILRGRVRPGHFDGVATVVARLFGIIGPDVAGLVKRIISSSW